MKFVPLEIEGAYVVAAEPVVDERGFFARSYCAQEFADHGMASVFVQASLSSNRVAGTLRGMHFQKAPSGQAKIIRCTRGALLDVIVDLRPESPAYCQWEAVELTAENRRMLYMPEGIAHGYLTLADETEAYYHASAPWDPTAEGGVRWNDPAFGIDWPSAPVVVSAKDAGWPGYQRRA